MMINFEAVVRHFWPKALRTIQDWNDLEHDQKGIGAITDKQLSTRRHDLRGWLQSYAVFQGLTGAQRDQITDAVLVWADARDPRRDLTTPEALADAHKKLMEAIQAAWILNQADAKRRDFTSLASKALWLCYPDSVPIFDAQTRYALYVVSKIEDGITPISEKTPEYEQFVHVWKQLYSKYQETIENLNIANYPYRVRVFDRILWLIGRPSYRTDWTSPRSTQV
jgi:hypothetical protein